MRDKAVLQANVAEVTREPKGELLRLNNAGKLILVYIPEENSKLIHNCDILKLAQEQNWRLSLDI